MKQMEILEPTVSIKSSMKEENLEALALLKDSIIGSLNG